MTTITFGKLKPLSPVEETYSCVMETPKRIVLKAQRYQVMQEAYKVRGFSRGRDGKDRPNGISFTAFGKIVGIKHLGAA